MKIHEYQAKEVLKSYGVPVPKGGVAETPEEARKINLIWGQTCNFAISCLTEKERLDAVD
jgi:succinyl-CoA synthetase beta subunit